MNFSGSFEPGYDFSMLTLLARSQPTICGAALHFPHQRRLVVIDQRNDAAHRTLKPDVPDEGARVDVGNDGNSVGDEIVVERFRRAPVAGNRRHPPNDKGFEKRLSGFDVFGIDAGIADQRVGHRDDLTGVGRIRQDLLIARHRGVEDDFADGFALKAVSLSSKNTPVFEQQRRAFRCCHAQSSVPILFTGQ